jgi:hypothetical protein
LLIEWLCEFKIGYKKVYQFKCARNNFRIVTIESTTDRA